MDLKPWNPWQEIERVQRQADDLLLAALEKFRRSVPGKPIGFVPAMDIVEDDEGYRLLLELPGLVEEDIDITVKGDILIVRGEREPPYDPRQVQTYQRQWRHGYFERRVQLPSLIDGDLVHASYEAGVLAIRIPKSGFHSAGGPCHNSSAGDSSSGASSAGNSSSGSPGLGLGGEEKQTRNPGDIQR